MFSLCGWTNQKHRCSSRRLKDNASLANGFTYQYRQINALLKKHENRSISFVGFPCNQFALQEPADNKTELLNGLHYVRPGSGYIPLFDLMAKVNVNGPQEDHFYTYLKNSCPRLPDNAAFRVRRSFWDPIRPSDVVWNFEKFIVDKYGMPRYRILSAVAPDDIENILVSMTLEDSANNPTTASNIVKIIEETFDAIELKFTMV
ncbi:Glutathione peroxidase 3 [Mizuhopecten yessoensis]|uniref:Glutathione peroxidase n=1 Tax=Mizuhopecten yessoensis TaxID=6573 RepID=A0A210PTR7_MIZYE|nr:Glutathione peroxidase 3 [Mizuhopecten yessoensis]